MKKSQFNYFLPPDLIAKYPLPNRSDSKLLVYNKALDQITHSAFKSLPNFLKTGDLLVFNNSKVIPARFYGNKETGGKVEFLVEKIIDEHLFIAHIKASKAPKNNSNINLTNDFKITVIEKQDSLYFCKAHVDIHFLLDSIGHMPLPLYIDRSDDNSDTIRYQTVYAKELGSVAAPTAGLHFDEETFNKLKESGIKTAYTTLHVGAGTFQPVRADDIKDHKMHKERFIISEDLASAVNATKNNGGRVIAVGTTAMRSLESAATSHNSIEIGDRDTDIFITPGYEFKICDGLITNFHLPESSLIMLVSAFIGHKQTMNLYAEAIDHQYRFYSYGDVSLLI